MAADLLTKSASAKNGLAIDTISAWPDANTSSATSGVLIRLVVTKGIDTSFFIRSVIQVNAARGTEVTMVGTRASCQPMPVLMSVAPAFSTAFAIVTTSSHVLPPSTKSSIDKRKIMINFSPTFSRTALMVSIPKRIRFSILPPQSSVR